MSKTQLKFIFLASGFIILALAACSTNYKSVGRKEYKKSKTLSTYSAMRNELQDECLSLKENNYFEYYDKLWLIVSVKQSVYIGKYSIINDTIFLNWLAKDPKKIHPYLSGKCIIDSTSKELWFIDEISNFKLRGLSQK